MSITPISVGFVTVGNEDTASTRHRVLDPIEFFDDNIDVEVLSFRTYQNYSPIPIANKILFILRVLSFSRNKDILFIQKIPLPKEIIKLLTIRVPTVVFDFDDALYTSPRWKTDNLTRRKRLTETIESSTGVVTGNPNLSEFARRYNEQVYTLPTCVPKEDQINYDLNPDRITIGWIGGPGNLRYLHQIKEPLTRILDNYDSNLIIITGEDRPVEPLKNNEKVQYTSWSLEKEREMLANIDIAIRPMWDSEWINGKGGYTSVIRCMSLGIPVVASPIDPLKKLTTPGESIVFASNEEEWYNKLEYLISDDNSRNEIGVQARKEIASRRLWTEDYASRLQNTLLEIHYDQE